jgi:DNA repair exonuclease SbcCD ATPase subunit
MTITKVVLTNFQCHEHLELEFSKGTNVIFGRSSSGKSTIVRAIRWALIPSELKGDGIRKEGTKKTSVAITFDNGATIERIKTSSTNSYKLTIGNEIKEYNATGLTLPDEIEKLITIKPIEIDKESIILNIANQLEMPFLLEKSGSFRQKLLNKLIGNEAIDQIFQDLNKDILQVGRDEKTEKEQIANLTAQLELVDKDKEKVNQQYKQSNDLLGNLKEKLARYEKLNDLLSKFKIVSSELNECVLELKSIKLISKETLKDLKVSIDKFNKLSNWQSKLSQINIQINDTNKNLKLIKLISKDELKLLEQKVNKFDNLLSLKKNWDKVNGELNKINSKLKELVIPKIDIKDLKKKVDKLELLVKLNKKLIQVNRDKNNIISNLAEISQELDEVIDKHKQLLTEMKICPLCKRKMDDKTIENLVIK